MLGIATWSVSDPGGKEGERDFQKSLDSCYLHDASEYIIYLSVECVKNGQKLKYY
jgi:hypothetical protein